MKPFQPISVKDKLPHILIIPALWGIPILYGTVYLAPQLFPFFLLYSNHIQSVYDLQKYKIWLTYQRHLDRKIRYRERQPG